MCQQGFLKHSPMEMPALSGVHKVIQYTNYMVELNLITTQSKLWHFKSIRDNYMIISEQSH